MAEAGEHNDRGLAERVAVDFRSWVLSGAQVALSGPGSLSLRFLFYKAETMTPLTPGG